jgi:hypothetical protein
MRNTMTRWIVTAADAPVLIFECGGRCCTLREMWNRADSAAYVFPKPRPDRLKTRGPVIKLEAVRAD